MPHLILAAFCLIATPALAHTSSARAGTSTYWLGVSLLVVAIWYTRGLTRLWPHTHARRPMAWRAVAFYAGCVALGIALLPPLDLAAHRSFAFHMVQHETLMLVAAPLLVLGRGLPMFLWALPREGRRGAGRATRWPGTRGIWTRITSPMSAWLLHAAALWAWHVPAWFNAAVTNAAVHHAQHVSFLVTALIFWHALLRHAGQGARGMGLVYLFTTTIHTGVLGALLTFAPRPLYATLDRGLQDASALTPLEDQQLGGLIMWVPGALVYVAVALWLTARWLHALSTSTDAARPL
jgi:putative membrane protein